MSKLNGNLNITYYDSRGLSSAGDSIPDRINAGTKQTNIITLTSWISNDVAEKIDRHNLLQFPIGSAAFSKSNLLSSVLMTEKAESESTCLVKKLASCSKIAIMYFNNDYGITWFNTLSGNLGSKVVGSEDYTDNQTSFTAELSRIAHISPEVVVLISTREAGLILKQAAQQGLHLLFLRMIFYRSLANK